MPKSLSGYALLRIVNPGDLFTNDLDICKKEYKHYAKLFHPDIIKSSAEFEHLNNLYQLAIEMIKLGTWEKTNYLQLKTGRKVIEVNYLYTVSDAISSTYVCNKHILIVHGQQFSQFYTNAIKIIKSIKYGDEQMKTKYSYLVPTLISAYEVNVSGCGCLLLSTNENRFSMSATYKYFKGQIPAVHVVWMISRLLGLACFFNFNKIVHNAITMENCYVNVQDHSVFIYGGYEYSTFVGEKMTASPSEIYEIMSPLTKSTKLASYSTDIESIKLLGRKLMGEEDSRKFFLKTSIPLAIREFLVSGSTEDTVAEFAKWDEAIIKAYGAHKFVVMYLKKDAVYDEGYYDIKHK